MTDLDEATRTKAVKAAYAATCRSIGADDDGNLDDLEDFATAATRT